MRNVVHRKIFKLNYGNVCIYGVLLEKGRRRIYKDDVMENTINVFPSS